MSAAKKTTEEEYDEDIDDLLSGEQDEELTEAEFLGLLQSYKTIREKDWRGWGPYNKLLAPTTGASATGASAPPAVASPPPRQDLFSSLFPQPPASSPASTFKFDPKVNFWQNLRNLVTLLYPPNSQAEVDRVLKRFQQSHKDWLQTLNLDEMERVAAVFPAK